MVGTVWVPHVLGATHFVYSPSADEAQSAALRSSSTYIQAAVDAANDGDVVLVSQGRHRLSAPIIIEKGITLKSVSGPLLTVIDGQNLVGVVRMTHPGATLDGFLIMDGRSFGSGTWGSGGGVYCRDGIVQNCIIRSSEARYRGGGVACSGKSIIRNCLIIDNHGETGGGIAMQSACLVENCTIARNHGGGGGGVSFYKGGTVRNSIVVNNTFRDWGKTDYGASGAFYNSCTTPMPRGKGNIVANPKFIPETLLLLDPSSPCLNAGTNKTWMSDGSDLSGGQRIEGGTVDMGCYELVLGKGVPEVFTRWDHQGSSEGTTHYAVEGSNGLHVVGSMVVSNSANGHVLAFDRPAGPDFTWTAPAVELTPGENRIFVIGRNKDGITASASILVLPRGTGSPAIRLTTPTQRTLHRESAFVFAGEHNSAVAGHLSISNSATRELLRVPAAEAQPYTWRSPTVDLALGTNVVWISGTNLGGEVVMTNTVVVGMPETYYVSASNATPVFPYYSWDTASTGIQEAVSASGDGNLVLIAGGTYVLPSCVYVTNAVTIANASASSVPLIQGQNAFRCFDVRHPGARLRGLSISGGNPQAVWVSKGGMIEDCIIHENRAGVYVGPTGSVRDSLIESNETVGAFCNYTGNISNCTVQANGGDGIYYVAPTGSVKTRHNIQRCFVTQNGGTGVSLGLGASVWHSMIVSNKLHGILLRRHGTAVNCIVAGNRGDGIHTTSWGEVQNCTVTENHGNGVYNAASHVKYENMIIYGNGLESGAEWVGKARWTAVWTSPPVSGTSTTGLDPMLLKGKNGAYYLAPLSPCIDRGKLRPWMTYIPDILGNERVSGTAVDLGAVEFDASRGPLACGFEVDALERILPFPVVFTATVSGTNTSNLLYYWDFDGDGTTDLSGGGLDHITNTYQTPGMISVSLTVVNGEGESFVFKKDDYIYVAPTEVFVSKSGSQTFPYATWDTAAGDIPTAIAATALGTIVTVGPGDYDVSAGLWLYDPNLIRSAAGWEHTTLRGSTAGSCVLMADHRAVLDGFTIENGSADLGGGVYVYLGTVQNCRIRNNTADRGGGVFLYWGDIINSIVEQNVAREGGGIYVDEYATISNCVVTGNEATRGGGMVVRGWPSVLINTVVYGNRAETGGGALIQGDFDVRNCTVAHNVASIRGGGIAYTVHFNHNTQRYIGNSIIAENAAPEAPNHIQLEVESWGEPQIDFAFTCASPLLPGIGNIDADPRLAGTHRLRADSPCIDAGSATNAPITDFEGDARWDDPNHENVVSSVDIGADEFVDVDSDGLADSWEMDVFGTLRRRGNRDTDHDGLSDQKEHDRGTSPMHSDSDDDRIPDGWEVRFGTDPTSSDANHDSDLDGHTHLEEWRAGTDPLDPASILRISEVDVSTGGAVVSWATAFGRGYRVQKTSNLSLDEWTDVTRHPVYEFRLRRGGIKSILDRNAPDHAPVFYRVMLTEPREAPQFNRHGPRWSPWFDLGH